MKILGIRGGHDSAAALILDGEIIADVAEERFTRIKNDASFPINAIEYCLQKGGIESEQLDCVALAGLKTLDLFLPFFSIPESNLPKKYLSLRKKLINKIGKYLGSNNENRIVLPLYKKPYKLSHKCKIHFCGHHMAHAASCYYTSGLNNEKVLIFTLDGIGDGVSVGIWRGENNRIKPLQLFDRSASLGYFYANATEAMGWRHGSDEWKLMGLAPYGAPQPEKLRDFYPEFKNGYLVKPHKYGEFGSWNDHGANHYHGKDSAFLQKKVKELGRENFAAEAQRVIEEQAFNLILPWLANEKARHLCCAGGVFLNVKMNQKLWYTGLLDTQWIYPNPGDAGMAVGAALHAFYTEFTEHRHQRISNVYFGPEFSNDNISKILNNRGLTYQYVDNPSEVAAQYLAKNLIVAWFQGRMESGPRALGNRSILMSPLKPENKDIINERIKYREPFRPFCPSILYEKSNDYLIKSREEMFMITSFDVKEHKWDCIPAVVHVDKTARPQMVKKEINPRYYDLIKYFGELTGEYVILNTSFNVKGEPIVCHPREAIRCFFDTGIDILFLNNYVLEKPALYKQENIKL